MKRARPLLKTFRLENELNVFLAIFKRNETKSNDYMRIYCRS